MPNVCWQTQLSRLTSHPFSVRCCAAGVMKICFSETPNNAPALVVGYRSGKVVVCTQFEQEIGQKPGTGEGKWSSVPDQSRKSDRNRVQKRKSGRLYPI